MPKCFKCDLECVQREEKGKLFGFPCDCCNKIVCKNCSKLSASEVRCVPMNLRALLFCCPECIANIKDAAKLSVQAKAVKKQVSELLERDHEFSHEVSRMSEAMETIDKRLASLNDEVEQLKRNKTGTPEADIAKIAERVRRLESGHTNMSGKEANTNVCNAVEPTITEIMERERRATNVLIFGLVEQKAPTKEIRLEKEAFAIKELLKEVNPGSDLSSIKFHRIGTYQPEGIRPVKVIFPTKSEAHEILKNKQKLVNTGTYLKYDQTLAQREYLKNVLKQLEDRKAKGESNISIKYIRGTPTITKRRTSEEYAQETSS